MIVNLAAELPNALRLFDMLLTILCLLDEISICYRKACLSVTFVVI